MAELVRSIDIAATFVLPENEIETLIVRACAIGEIASWAGRAEFTEGDRRHIETDWKVSPEAWVSQTGLQLNSCTFGHPNPCFSLRDGTLRGEGFSPVFLGGHEPRIVDVKSIGFVLTRLAFDADDLAYYLKLDKDRGRLPRRAAKGDRLNEAAAHEAAKMVRNGLSIQAAAIEVVHMVEAKNRDPASIVRGIRNAFNLMYDKRGKPIKN